MYVHTSINHAGDTYGGWWASTFYLLSLRLFEKVGAYGNSEWPYLTSGCSKHIANVAFRAKPNGRYIEVAVLQRAGIARVYCKKNLTLFHGMDKMSAKFCYHSISNLIWGTRSAFAKPIFEGNLTLAGQWQLPKVRPLGKNFEHYVYRIRSKIIILYFSSGYLTPCWET